MDCFTNNFLFFLVSMMRVILSRLTSFTLYLQCHLLRVQMPKWWLYYPVRLLLQLINIAVIPWIVIHVSSTKVFKQFSYCIGVFIGVSTQRHLIHIQFDIINFIFIAVFYMTRPFSCLLILTGLYTCLDTSNSDFVFWCFVPALRKTCEGVFNKEFYCDTDWL